MKSVIVDAGPLVALLSRRDKNHATCVSVFQSMRDPLLTSWPAVTEALYLLSFSTQAQYALLKMIERGSVVVESPIQSALPGIRSLMRQYADLPMEFADATLVALAHAHKIERIFTLDKRDFSLYRLARGKSFVILPE